MRLPSILPVLSAIIGLGAGEAPLPLDADAAAGLAATRSVSVQAAMAAAQANRLEADAALGFARPQLGADASAAHAEGILNPGLAYGGDREQYAASATATQYLWGFGRLDAARMAKAAIEDRAALAVAIARRDLAFRARVAVAAAQFAAETVQISERRLATRASERDDVAARVRAGVAAEADLRLAEAGVLAAEADLAAARAQADAALIDLAEAVDRPSGSVALAGPLSEPQDLVQLLAAARAVDPAEARDQRAAARQSSALARGERAGATPVVSAFATWRFQDDRTDELDDHDGWSAGVRLDWSLFDGGGRYLRADAAAQRSAAASLLAAAEVRARTAELDRLGVRLTQTATTLDLRRRTAELTARSYEDVRARYAAGVETATRVDQANLQLFESRQAVAATIYERVVLQAALRRWNDG